jgi:TolC family type I secretion outer membrane protein
MLEFVYENHPALIAKREELKAIDEGVAQAISGFRPSISANLSKGRQRSGNANDTWNYNNSKSRSLNVEQPIFNGGGTIASFNVANDRVNAARAELSALEQQTLYDAIVAYSDVVEKQSVFALNQKNVEVLQQQFADTKARFNVGLQTVTDVAQASSRLATAQSYKQQSLSDLEVAKASFQRVIGYAAPEKISMPPVPAGIPENITLANELAHKNNPILEAARHNEKAAENNIDVNGASILPSISLQGTMSRADGVATAINHVDSDAIKLNLTIPIYQSGAEWSRLRAARNQAQQAKFNVIDTNAAVLENVASAWGSFNAAKAIIIANQEAVKAAETARNGVQKEKEFGVRTVLDLLNAEQEEFTAKVNLIKAERSEKILAYRLLATIGKLTSDELGLATNVKPPTEHYDSVKYQLLGW